MSTWYGDLKTVKCAKKNHICSLCETEIEKNGDYLKYCGNDNGDFFALKFHRFCYNFYEKRIDREDPVYNSECFHEDMEIWRKEMGIIAGKYLGRKVGKEWNGVK